MAGIGKSKRWIALGVACGLMAAWGGFAVADAAPSSITTCTKVSNGKPKIITSAEISKCTAKGKGFASTWDSHQVVVGQLAAKNAQIATLQNKASTFCAELNNMVNYWQTNDPPTFSGFQNYLIGHPQMTAAYSALCF